MKAFFPVLLLISLFFACTSTEDSNNPGKEDVSVDGGSEGPICFEQRMDDSSVFTVSVTEKEGRVKGDLSYQFHEKDSASGTYEGVKEGDHYRIVWDYTIEGSNQKEEIIFKIEGDKWRRMNGELVEKDGILVLKDTATASYNETFMKVPCR